MSEPMDTREEEWTLPIDGEFEVIDGGLRKSVVPLEIHKAALIANREKDAELALLREEAGSKDFTAAWLLRDDQLREKDAEIERLKIELAKTGTGDYKGDFYLGRKTLSGYLRDAEDDRDGWKRMYDAKKAEISSLRASVGGEKWIDVKQELPTPGRDVLIYFPHWSVRPFIGCYLSTGMWQGEQILSDEGSPTHWQPLPAPPSLPTEKE